MGSVRKESFARGFFFSPKWHLVSRTLLWLYRFQRKQLAFRLFSLLSCLILGSLLAFAFRGYWLDFFMEKVWQSLLGIV